MKKKYLILLLIVFTIGVISITSNYNITNIKVDAVSSARLDTIIWGIISYGLIIFYVVLVLRALWVILFSKDNKFKREHQDITLYKLKEYLPTYDLNKLKQEICNTYIGIQEAYDKYNYKRLKRLCTNELYNIYYEELKNTENNQVINNNRYKIRDITIYNITSTKDKIIIHTYLSIETKYKVLDYKLIFLKSKNNTITICPNCSSEIKDTTNITTCPYCNSILETLPSKFILSSKRDININKYYEQSFNEEFFISKVKNMFVKYLKAITEDKLQEIDYFIADDLYKETKSIIESYKDKKIKKVYESINIEKSDIKDLYDKENNNVIEVILKVVYKEYNIDINNKIIGNKELQPVTYLLTLSKDKNVKGNRVIKCPGCGTTIDINENGKCPYCDTIYNQEDYDYVLTSIRKIEN